MLISTTSTLDGDLVFPCWFTNAHTNTYEGVTLEPLNNRADP